MSEKKEVKIIADEEAIQAIVNAVSKELEKFKRPLQLTAQDISTVGHHLATCPDCSNALAHVVAKHLSSCPECSEALNKTVKNHLEAFKAELMKTIEEKVKYLGKEEKKVEQKERGGLW
jgi:protein-arginine kinase activator protein McsA